MNVDVFKIKNVDYKISKIRYYFEDNYPESINLYLIGTWYKVFNEDAKLISKIFNYKLFDDTYSPYLGNICCGFPESVDNKIREKLKSLKINFNLINLNFNIYESFDFGEENKYSEYGNLMSSLKEEPIVKETVISTPKVSNRRTGLVVEIGDTVTIRDIENNSIETYTINPTYHNYEAIGYSADRGNNFGGVIYKDTLIDKSNLEEGKILSESDFAQRLLGADLNGTVLLLDDDLNERRYEIIEIKKH